jgi:hypothetical protein
MNLPEIVAYTPDGLPDKDTTESQWEKRATILAQENEKHRSAPTTPIRSPSAEFAEMHLGDDPTKWASRDRSRSPKGQVSSKAIDDDIQEAIRLHEEGDLERSTVIFGRLADPKGANNPLSQVLYGLALRFVSSHVVASSSFCGY